MTPSIELEREHHFTFYTVTCSICEDVIVQPTFDKKYCHREARNHNEEKHGGLKFAIVQGFNHYPGLRDLGVV